MILSSPKFVGLNLRRSEFTFHDSAPLINLHSMLGWLVVFFLVHPLFMIRHHSLIRHHYEFGMVNLRSLLNLDLIRP